MDTRCIAIADAVPTHLRVREPDVLKLSRDANG
jgi:hypothetical protein